MFHKKKRSTSWINDEAVAEKKKHNCPNTKPPMKTGTQDTQRCSVQKAFLDPPHKVNLRKMFLLVLPCKPK